MSSEAESAQGPSPHRAADAARVGGGDELAGRRDDIARVRELLEAGARLASLTGPGGPARHHDLAKTIDWSLELLGSDARELLLALSVCAGSFGLETVEALCPPEVTQPLDALAELVDVHLVAPAVDEQDPATVRYRLLESIAEHVSGRLRAEGGLERARRRRVELTQTWLEEAADGLRGTRELQWQRRVERELPELTALLDHRRDAQDARHGLLAAVALAPFWAEVGPRDEGRDRLAFFLDLSGPDSRDGLHLEARAWEGHLAAEAGDRRGLNRLAAAVDQLPATDAAPRTVVEAAVLLIRSLTADGQIDRADDEARRWEATCRDLGLDDLLASVLYRRAFIARQRREHDLALALARESRDLAARLGHAGFLARSEAFVGHQAGSALDPSLTLPLIEEGVRRSLSARQWTASAWAMVDAGAAASAAGSDGVALDWARQALHTSVRIDHWQAQVCAAALVVGIALEHAHHDAGLRLHGALAPRLEEFAPGIVPPAYLLSYESAVAEAISAVGQARAAAAIARHPTDWAEVLAEVMALADLLANGASAATEATEPIAATRSAPPAPGDGLLIVAGQVEPLTERELEILAALVGGGTNREIAADLYISPKTVMHHAASIYRKLGVRNRAEAVVCALRAGIDPFTSPLEPPPRV